MRAQAAVAKITQDPERGALASDGPGPQNVDIPDIGVALTWGFVHAVRPGEGTAISRKEMTLGPIRNQLVRAAAVSALGVTAMAGFIAPASAAQVAASAHMTSVAPAAKPNTDIKASPVRWVPKTLTAPPTKGTCSATNYSFSVTNKTKTAKTIQYKSGTKKKTLGTLKAGKKGGVCATGSKGAKGKFYIKGSTSVLTVTLS